MGFHSIQLAVIAAILAVLVGCSDQQASNPETGDQSANFPEPDLEPLRRAGAHGPEGFCQRNDNGDLIVRVANQTNNPVLEPSTTTVVFERREGEADVTINKTTPPFGFITLVEFEIPSNCFSPDCRFTITVDTDNDIDESHGPVGVDHEANNTASGRCIG